MSAVEALSLVLAVLFLVLAAWTVVQWARWRTRATAFLAVAFTSLAVAIVLDRLAALTPFGVPWPPLLVALNIVLAAFPWLLAASVWSLESRRPRWAWVGMLGVPMLAVWLFSAPVFGETMSFVEGLAFLGSFGFVWAVAAVATAVRLRGAARRHVLARPRMRLMAAGMLTLTAALLIDLAGSTNASPALEAVMNGAAVLAATMFLLGFLPPRALRLWWRRDASATFQQMQADLLSAVSRHEVATAVTRPMGELLGSGAIIIDEGGVVIDQHGVPADRVAEIAEQVRVGGRLDSSVRASSVGRGWLVVVASPYTPVFGQDELDLVDAHASHVRLALERAELFESITTQQRDLEAMLLGLAHDIRSPTAAISGSFQLMVDADDRDLRTELTDIVQDSTAYLLRLVDAMVELGQARSGARDREVVELGALAKRVAERLQTTHPRLRIEVRSDGAAVLMAPVRAEQLFDNLLGNAAKHGGRDDLTITVEIAARADGVEVVVADDGVGIPPVDQHRIFTPFQRGSRAIGVGNGLGLGLVRRIVDDHGGRVELEPSPCGARFGIRLPGEDTLASTQGSERLV